ncbi:SoxR reducing system RseC family protein [Sulfuritalea sp.]|uniref:SoxR reducing system RseC family protein n=1 Tax=Sulfuritalea sp. TaxID=2480090 RepID=UPI001AD4B6D0|nr:SoxR reducing system RseC family protein [Sulfuritalea sp.]MBN8474747.1 SoxR reducing system RseC family protein [Sulfuritalea sp.]
MSQCEARVVAASGSEVWVEVAGRAPTCGNCKTADACQTGLLGLTAGPRRYRVVNRVGAQVGDQVQLVVAEGTLWRASLWSYAAPLLLAISGAVIGQSMSGDAAAVAGTVVGLVCGVGVLRWNEVRARGEGSLFTLQVRTMEKRFKEQS